jgi:alkylation response protein AidB-like acyl-CoA dehydrogenase
VALGESVRSLCASRFPTEHLRRLADGPAPAPLDTDAWASLAGAGVFDLQVPETSGGVGLGMGASAVVFEELGRFLVPGPLVASHLAARELRHALGGAQEGKLVVGSVSRERGAGERGAGERGAGERGAAERGAGELAPTLVSHLDSLDALVVVGEAGLEVLGADDVDAVEVARPLDPLTPLWKLSTLPRGEVAAGPDAARVWSRDEQVLTGALLVGSAARCTEMAVEYAKEREQFGRPIGSFQAVKHICADMLVRAETARAAVQAAAVNVDQPDVGDAERAAAGAAMLASRAAISNAKACIQVHGGMGFTWEVPVHLYLRRAKVLDELTLSRRDLARVVAERW